MWLIFRLICDGDISVTTSPVALVIETILFPSFMVTLQGLVSQWFGLGNFLSLALKFDIRVG